jgi:hypothetical protein
MRNKALGVVVLVICFGLGCQKKESPPAGKDTPAKATPGKTGDLDPTVRMAIDWVSKDIQRAKEKVAKGEDAKYACVAALAKTDALRKSTDAEAQRVLKEAEQACGYDIPIELVGRGLAKVEADRKAKPDRPVSYECVDPQVLLKDLRQKHGADPKVKALDARYQALCGALK